LFGGANATANRNLTSIVQTTIGSNGTITGNAKHEVWINATGTVNIAYGSKVATSESASTILVDSGALNLVGELDAGATLDGSTPTFTGENAEVQIVASGMVMVGGQRIESSGNTLTAGGSINATGLVSIAQNGAVPMGLVVSATSAHLGCDRLWG
jgi:hypothetical protein